MLITLENRIDRKIKEESFLWKVWMLTSHSIRDPSYIFKKEKLIPWVPNKKFVEVEITTRCSLSCFNCDRSVRQAPSNECMSLGQIEEFVNESIELNMGWKRIRLMGGEPTLHPQFFEILNIVKRYKNINPKCNIEISTNGYGSKVNEALSKLPEWVNVRNSKKESNIHKFIDYNVAPIDLEEYKNADFTKGCWITEECGLGLSRMGYYPCGAGASVDRVFGFNIGIKRLSLVNHSTLKNQLILLCKYCGHYKKNLKRITEEKMSASWHKAYEKYKKENQICP